MRLKLVKDETHIKFFKYAKVTFGASVVAVIASIIIFLSNGLNYGIDFRGGTMMRIESPVDSGVGALRDVLSPLGLGDINVTEVFDPSTAVTATSSHEYMVRVEQQGDDEAQQNAAVLLIKQTLDANFDGLIYLQTDAVSGKVSGELIQSGIIAVLISVVAVLFYVWLRFEWQFSVGAVAALVHDVILTIGVFSLIGLEFNLSIIAALLTIVGYSLNDTVVVFDRVRENLRKFKTMDLKELLDLAINETLSRTVMTAVTTLLALFALYFLGGDVVRGFTFAMIWGIVVGTYSSVFVASNIVLWLDVKRDWSKPDPNAGTQFADIDA
ncbi:protein translocase subunit SecF [Abyssibius alkaniclasticus]|uniref:protein translocase subunit SecF n=1 Tax=Abyssibius alkaniclasticus TaxID=2881234 RepID=UPI0023648905|nr:protein translocase subunit SecF [Abyssibius alkaniclasticus]UPH70486.1 protein translocase subunit SecF [Abyssibius alkaniclasticus]